MINLDEPIVELVHGWQASAEGKVSGAVTQLANATSELRAMSLDSATREFVKRERPDLELAYRQLGRMLGAA